MVDVVSSLVEFDRHARYPIALTRSSMRRTDQRGQRRVGLRTSRRNTMAPRIVPTGGHAQDTAHGADGVDLLMSAHEFEDLDGFESASRANQVAAFERMSLSTRNCLISRRRRCSSWSSSVVKPPSPEPSSRSACCTQLRIDSGDGSNSLANYSGVRPARTNSTIWRRNSGAYGVCVLGRSSSLPKYRDVHHTGVTPLSPIRLRFDNLKASKQT